MLRNQHIRGGAVALGVCLALAGCQNSALQPTHVSLFRRGDQDKLSPAQAADVQVAYGRSLEKRGLTEQAAKVYQEALKKDPTRSEAYLRLAIMKDQQGKFAESAELYRKALKAKPGSANIYCCMGYSLYLQHRLPEAEMNLAQAIAVNPDLGRAHNNLGLVLAQTNRPKEAMDEFFKGGCSEADAHINTAFGLTLAEHWPEARIHYERALAADPSSAVAQQGLQELDGMLAKSGGAPLPTPFSKIVHAQDMPGPVMAKSPEHPLFANPPVTAKSPDHPVFAAVTAKSPDHSLFGNPLGGANPAFSRMDPYPTVKSDIKHALVPVSDVPEKPAKVNFDLSPGSGKTRGQQASKAVDQKVARISAQASEPYVTQGTIVMPMPESTPPSPKAKQLTQRIADSCAIPANKVELHFTSNSELEIHLLARNQDEANSLAQRVLLMPELHPYQVNVKVKIPQ
jgi:Tfp pilus assembly protein PilF